jgi:hypothetical protein
MLLVRDAAIPPVVWPNTDGTLIYAGRMPDGSLASPQPDAYREWTPANIRNDNSRYRLPVWVCSNPGRNPYADANAFNRWAAAWKVPATTAVVLDLETLEVPAYCSAFYDVVGRAVFPYGSTSSLFKNPALSGYFVADPTGIPHMNTHPAVVMTQYAALGPYDLSLALDGIRPLFWDTKPTKSATEGAVNMGVIVGCIGQTTLYVDGGVAVKMFDQATINALIGAGAGNAGALPAMDYAEFAKLIPAGE